MSRAENKSQGRIAAPTVSATPFRKSRRVIPRSIPSSRSFGWFTRPPGFFVWTHSYGCSSRLKRAKLVVAKFGTNADCYVEKCLPLDLAADARAVQMFSAFLTADSAPSNPIRLWVPSQNGLFTDPPHRHRENAGLPVKSYLLPSASTSSIEPSGSSTRYGPFFLTVILTAAMKPPCSI